MQEHLKLGHARRDKTWLEVEKEFYGIQKHDVEWIVAHCKTCIANSSMQTQHLANQQCSTTTQTQGLVGQGNSVVKTKLIAWKLDHGSTQ